MFSDRLRLWFPYLLLAGVVGVVIWANVDRGSMPEAGRSASGDVGRFVDVVCQMEVNRSWGIESTYNDETYYFCADRCKERFDADPPAFITPRCLVCQEPTQSAGQAYPATYLGKTYTLCSEAHRRTFKQDPAGFFMHQMWGIPSWLYYVSIALVMLVSFGVFDWLGRRERTVARGESRETGHSADRAGSESVERAHRSPSHAGPHAAGPMPPGVVPAGATGSVSLSLPMLVSSGSARARTTLSAPSRADRFDLLSIGWVRAAFRSRVFRFVLQAFVVAMFLMIIVAGLFGNQNPALNIAPILTWTVWWGFLVILILFAGKAWCYVCPWDALAGWTERLSFWRKRDEGLSLGLRWPRVVRNIAIATILFVGLTWIELGFGITMKPRVTAYLAIAMLMMTVVSMLLFDRRAFCRYACLVGRVSGLYALFSSVEIRARDAGACKACGTKECVTGSEHAYGCPTFLYPGKMETNTYCIQCMECVQACPHDNLAVNMRPWGSDLVLEGKPRSDEAYLALLMLAITGFHGLTMTPVWQQMIDGIRQASGVGRILGFSVGMALLMLVPVGIYAVLVAVSKALTRGTASRGLTYRDYFVRYAYALLPIALFYHIAHNLEHLLMEGPKVLAMISDPLGWQWNLFGTAHWTIPPLISLDKLWLVQVFLVLVGHVYSLWIAQKTSLRLFGSGKAAFRSQLPMLIGMICFSVFSLWLLKQPMEMRTSAM